MPATTVCTLFEGDYHYGVAALANSLFRYGYRGVIHVGYRGLLPNWMRKFEIGENCSITEGLEFRLYPLDTPWHLANYKPLFIKSIFASAPSLEAVFYFDPDIVIKCQWTYYEEWVRERHVPGRGNCHLRNALQSPDSPTMDVRCKGVGASNANPRSANILILGSLAS
jgi:hypothetical protein